MQHVGNAGAHLPEAVARWLDATGSEGAHLELVHARRSRIVAWRVARQAAICGCCLLALPCVLVLSWLGWDEAFDLDDLWLGVREQHHELTLRRVRGDGSIDDAVIHAVRGGEGPAILAALLAHLRATGRVMIESWALGAESPIDARRWRGDRAALADPEMGRADAIAALRECGCVVAERDDGVIEIRRVLPQVAPWLATLLLVVLAPALLLIALSRSGRRLVADLVATARGARPPERVLRLAGDRIEGAIDASGGPRDAWSIPFSDVVAVVSGPELGWDHPVPRWRDAARAVRASGELAEVWDAPAPESHRIVDLVRIELERRAERGYR